MDNILHDVVAHKFYIVFPEGEAALNYAIVDDHTLDFYSTYVPPDLRGRKIAQMLVKSGFTYAKVNSFKVIPSCPYVKLYLKRHLHE